MSENADRTVALVKRSLASETVPVFEDRLEEQAEWLRAAIEDGVMDSSDFTVGLEMEAYAITDQTTKEENGDGGPNLTPLPEAVFETPSVNKELGVHNVEINTDPTVLGNGGLAAQAEEIQNRTRKANATIEEHGCELVLDAMWTLPPAEGSVPYLSAVEERDGVVFAENMRQNPRYVAIDNHALELADGDQLPFSVPGGEFSFPSLLFESLATSIQPHLQIPEATEFPAYYNAAIRTLSPVLALSSNSPFLPADMYTAVDDPEALVDETHHELRVAAFEQSVNHTPNAKVRVPRDITDATDVVDRVLADDRYAPFLREWVEGDEERQALSDRVWEFDHKRGTYWRWLRCVVGGDRVNAENDQYSLRIEYRPIPTQPTVADVVGIQALVAGLIRGVVAADHPLAELPWDAAETSFYNAATAGLDAELHWMTADGERTTDSAVIFDELFSLARTGLHAANVPGSDIDEYLSPIETRWETRTTPSVWKKRNVRAALEDGADLQSAVTEMQREYIRLRNESESFAEWV